ncbi:E3 ubiquitin-protein ligase bre1 [Binucleata daphniae]
MVEKRKSELDNIQKRQHSITQTLHNIILENDIDTKAYTKIEIEEQKNQIAMLTKRLQLYENICNKDDIVYACEVDNKENEHVNKKRNSIDDRLRNEIKRLEIEALEYKNELTRIKNSKQKRENIEKQDNEEKTNTQENVTINNTDVVLLQNKIKNIENENNSLRNEINKQVSEILHDRNKYTIEIEKISNDFDMIYKKCKEEKSILKNSVAEAQKKLEEIKIENETINEKYTKMKAQIQEIEALKQNDAEKANLYKEIIKLTKLYEDSLENASLYLVKKREYEKQEKMKLDLEEEVSELKEKIKENDKLQVLYVERIKYEKLMNDYIERKNAANYHKRNSIKAHNDLLCLESKIKEIENKKCTNNFDKADDLENYRKLLRCTSCDKNYKDTIILRCMHVFCKECIDNRIKTRNRNCPSCNENFHTADVKKIYL